MKKQRRCVFYASPLLRRSKTRIVHISVLFLQRFLSMNPQTRLCRSVSFVVSIGDASFVTRLRPVPPASPFNESTNVYVQKRLLCCKHRRRFFSWHHKSQKIRIIGSKTERIYITGITLAKSTSSSSAYYTNKFLICTTPTSSSSALHQQVHHLHYTNKFITSTPTSSSPVHQVHGHTNKFITSATSRQHHTETSHWNFAFLDRLQRRYLNP
jgi:hypothetical protein